MAIATEPRSGKRIRITERRGGMSIRELADLSEEAGRPLTETEAQAYRIRKSTWDGVERRIQERRHP